MRSLKAVLYGVHALKSRSETPFRSGLCEGLELSPGLQPPLLPDALLLLSQHRSCPVSSLSSTGGPDWL